jgi:PII-like signaling protein
MNANGNLLRFHVPEGQRHQGMLLWEWLLRVGCDLGARGGSAVRPVAAFGRHHVLHEQKFFELAGSLTVEVELLLSEEQLQRLLELLESSAIRLFYTRTDVTFGVVNPDGEDSPQRSS